MCFFGVCEMQKDFTVCFFGHRRIENFYLAESRTEALIRQLVQEKPYVEILVGRDGEYDQIVTSTVLRVKRETSTDNCCLTWVLPYMKAELENDLTAFEAYYDSVEICEASSALHPKAAYQARNRNLVDRSDLCVFFVDHASGGAWKTLRYALRQEKQTVNLAEVKDSLAD